jgi:hypothetical protein
MYANLSIKYLLILAGALRYWQDQRDAKKRKKVDDQQLEYSGVDTWGRRSNLFKLYGHPDGGLYTTYIV